MARPSANLWRTLAWIGVSFNVIGLVALVSGRGWGEAWSLTLLLTFTLVALLTHDRVVPPLFACLTASLGVVNAAGILWGLYDDVVWYDDAAHFFGGFVAASVLGYVLLTNVLLVRRMSGVSLALWFGALALAVGVAWEILELLLIEITWADTLTDLVLDTTGGALAGPVTGWAINGAAPPEGRSGTPAD